MSEEVDPHSLSTLDALGEFIVAYRNAGRLVDTIRQWNAVRGYDPPPQELENLISSASDEIEREQKRGIERFGNDFKKGDYDGVLAIQQMTAHVQQTLVKKYLEIGFEESADFTPFVHDAERGRHGTMTALKQLQQRLLLPGGYSDAESVPPGWESGAIENSSDAQRFRDGLDKNEEAERKKLEKMVEEEEERARRQQDVDRELERLRRVYGVKPLPPPPMQDDEFSKDAHLPQGHLSQSQALDEPDLRTGKDLTPLPRLRRNPPFVPSEDISMRMELEKSKRGGKLIASGVHVSSGIAASNEDVLTEHQSSTLTLEEDWPLSNAMMNEQRNEPTLASAIVQSSTDAQSSLLGRPMNASGRSKAFEDGDNYTARQTELDSDLPEWHKNRALLNAIKEGQLSRVRHLIDLGANLDFTDDDAWFSAIDLACIKGDADIVRLLLDIGVPVDHRHWILGAPITIAILWGHPGIVDLLLRSGANVNVESDRVGNPIHAAIAMDDLDTVSQLLTAGAKPANQRLVAVSLAQELRWAPAPSTLIRQNKQFHGKRYTALDLAAHLGLVKIVRKLLEYDSKLISVNAFKRAFHQNHKVVGNALLDSLLASGLRRDLRDEGGFNLLHIAARYGQSAMAEKLIKHDWSTETRTNKGMTPLMVAVEHGQTDCVTLLLQLGANANSRDSDGANASTIATSKQFREIIQILEIGTRMAPAEEQTTKADREPVKKVPTKIQRGLLHQEVINRQRREQDEVSKSNVRMADDQPSEGEDSSSVDLLANIEVLPPGLRRVILMDADESILSTLPEHLRLEAESLKSKKRLPQPDQARGIDEDTTISKSTRVFSSNDRTDTSATSLSLDQFSSKDNQTSESIDRLTIRSRASGVALDLPETEEQQLITVFVQQLWQTMHRLLDPVPEPEIDEQGLEALLKTYSILMRQTVPISNHFEKGAIDFVQSRRRKIARRFSTLGRRPSDTSAESPLSVADHSSGITDEDISSWLSDVHDTTMPLEIPAELGEHTDDSSRISNLFRALPDMQRFLVENAAWKWLESQLLRTCMDQRTPAIAISERLREIGIPMDGPRVSVCFTLDWQPLVFLREQYPSSMQPDISNVITLVNSGDRTLVTTCGAYIQSTWPTFGPPMLQAIRRAVHDGAIDPIDLPHGTSGTVLVRGERLQAFVTAFPSILSDVGELLAWIGAACRESSEEDSHSYCKAAPSYINASSATQEDPWLYCEIAYTFRPVESLGLSENECWHLLFRNVSIADEFFVPKRLNGESGLEIPLALMVLLGDTPWADTFNNKFMLKGFSSSFVPKRILEGSILWHFQRDTDGAFLPYASGSGSCLKKNIVTSVDVAWLYQQRHFVGWTGNAEVHLGTENILYSQIDDPDADFVRSGMALEAATITGGYFLNIGTTWSKAHCQHPLHAPSSDDYFQNLRYISQSNVVLYDTGSRRAWLVDGAGALLHVTCCQLRSKEFASRSNLLDSIVAKHASSERRPLSVLTDRKTRMYVIRQEEDDLNESRMGNLPILKSSSHNFHDFSIDGTARVLVGVEDKSTTNYYDFASPLSSPIWRFQDLVASNCNYLIKAQEHEHNLKSKVRFTDRDQLEGWSFLDVVEQSTAFLKPRVVYLKPSGRGWTTYTRTVQAITLMADGFGELITPAQGENICQRWQNVPEGQDYLVTTVERLRYNSRKHGRKKDFPTFIADGVRWHQAHQLLEPCRCPAKECNPIQVILPTAAVRTKRPDVSLETFNHGAVIFGKTALFRLWFPRDAHKDPQKLGEGTAEHSDPEEDIRRPSVDGNIQVGEPETEDTTSRSSAPASDLYTIITPSDLTSGTPPTSLGQTSNENRHWGGNGDVQLGAHPPSASTASIQGAQARNARSGRWERFKIPFSRKARR